MIAVFDTNVFIAAIITEGMCSKILRRAYVGEFSLVSCSYITEEIERILSTKFGLALKEIDYAMTPITEATSRFIEDDLKVISVCRDSSDDAILACALAAGADYLVTGDADLLEIGNFHSIRIVTPRDFEALFL